MAMNELADFILVNLKPIRRAGDGRLHRPWSCLGCPWSYLGGPWSYLGGPWSYLGGSALCVSWWARSEGGPFRAARSCGRSGHVAERARMPSVLSLDRWPIIDPANLAPALVSSLRVFLY